MVVLTLFKLLSKILALTLRYTIEPLKFKIMQYEVFTNSFRGISKMSKKVSLLFACIVLISFTANAQEPVKAKVTKEPVKAAPAEKPIKEEKVTVPETTPHSDIHITTKPVEKIEKVEVGEVKASTSPKLVKRSTNAKASPVKREASKAKDTSIKK